MIKPRAFLTGVPSGSRAPWHVGALLLVFLLVAGYFSVQVPAFETPDEFQHYAFVQHVVTWYDLPQSAPDTPGLWRQQGVQAPLYYLLGAGLTFWIDQSSFPVTAHRVNPFAAVGAVHTPVNRNFFLPHAEDGWPWQQEFLALHMLRCLSVLLGCVTLYAVYRFTRMVLQHELALLATALCGFIPQFVFISGAASNDNLVTAMSCLLVWRLAVWLEACRRPDLDRHQCFQQTPWQLGALLAAVLLSKLIALGLVGLAGLAVAWVAWQQKEVRILWTVGWRMAVTVLLLAGWWFGRNVWMYGDPLAWNIWEANIVLRPVPLRFSDLRTELPLMFQNFWGLFGWNTVPYPSWVYVSLACLSTLWAAGVVLWLGRTIRDWDRHRRGGQNLHMVCTVLAAVWFGLLLISWFRFMLVAPAAQGRYLFPAFSVLALGTGAALSLLPAQLRKLAWSLPVMLLALCVITPSWIIAKAYRPPPVTQYEWMPLTPADAHSGPDLAHPEFHLIGIGMDPQLQPGTWHRVHIRLRALHPVSQDYALFLHLRDAAGHILAQYDGIPGGGLWPTSQWPVSETRTEAISFFLPAHVEPGTTGTVVIGLYNPWTWMRPLWQDHARLPDSHTDGFPNEYAVGQFQVVGADP